VSRADASVSEAVENVVNNSINGAAYRRSDASVYVTLDNPNEMWRLEPGDLWTMVAELPELPTGVTVAPAGYGDFGDMLIWTSVNGNLLVTDPNDGTSQVFASPGNQASAVAFGPDGTLYAVVYTTGVISTVEPDGTLTEFYDLPAAADGLVVSADNQSLYVSHFGFGAGIDAIKIPGVVFSEIIAADFDSGYYPSGLLLDGAGHLLYKSRIDGQASISAITP